MVNVTGKARVVRYMARIHEVNDGEYEGVFLHKVPSYLKNNCISFTTDEKDDASFFASDIVFKLPPPVLVGGTARRAKHLRFNCDLKKWKVILQHFHHQLISSRLIFIVGPHMAVVNCVIKVTEFVFL